MAETGTGRSLAWNPLVVLGLTIVFGTVALSGVVDASRDALVAQATVPVIVGVVISAYGLYINEDISTLPLWTVLSWTGFGVAAFFVVGFWFGTLSRRFDTSYTLAIFASLATGAVLGCIIGIYAARLQRANAELADQSRQLSEFADIVSHDLRNPLSVASGQLELVEGDEARIERIRQAHRRMDRIIDSVSTLTRRTGDSLAVESLSLAPLARQAWGTAETGASELDVVEDAEIAADQDLLVELLENLFRNSNEHAEQPVTVTVGETADGFYVADDGPGIPADEREQIFESGYSTGDGTGLGLMIVLRIATVHGWDVSVSESGGGGARFDFTV